ncbi:MAG: glycosyltransferase family 2 protein [Bacilli bacterium]|nr:glycosyltransferase family 2 protein [Bacilli bacterium]
MEKLLTVAVPCFNSASYMNRCLDSLLKGGSEIEIIIIDDGSTDDTGKIADSLKNRYPSICRVVHQENSGHGEGVNQGLLKAKGLYYKVVDSDDWVDIASLKKVLSLIKKLKNKGDLIDLLLVNYVYEHVLDGTQRKVSLKNVFKPNVKMSFEKAGSFRPGQYLMMHSLIYRTQLLREIEFKLPKHTFYVDNLMVYYPLPFVKSLYYLDVDFYRYFIGREDQSVNADVFIKRIDQHIRVTKLMIDRYELGEIRKLRPKLFKYLYRHLLQMMLVTSMFLTIYDSPENLEKRNELWSYLKRKMPILYPRFKFHVFGIISNLKGKTGQIVVLKLYEIGEKFLKSN